MKSTIILLGLSALLCAVNAFPSDRLAELKAEVRSATDDVNRVIDKLKRQKRDAVDDVYDKAQSIVNEKQDEYREYKSILIDGIRKQLKDFEAQGKKVGDCYEKAIEGIEVGEKKARKDADTCVQRAGTSIKNSLGYIDYLISRGSILEEDLGNVIVECHDSDDVRMETCIVSRLDTLKTAVEKLDNDTTSAPDTIVPVINNVITVATKCVENAYEPVYTGSTAIKMGISICVDDVNLTTKRTSPTSAATTPSPSSTAKEYY